MLPSHLLQAYAEGDHLSNPVQSSCPLSFQPAIIEAGESKQGSKGCVPFCMSSRGRINGTDAVRDHYSLSDWAMAGRLLSIPAVICGWISPMMLPVNLFARIPLRVQLLAMQIHPAPTIAPPTSISGSEQERHSRVVSASYPLCMCRRHSMLQTRLFLLYFPLRNLDRNHGPLVCSLGRGPTKVKALSEP